MQRSLLRLLIASLLVPPLLRGQHAGPPAPSTAPSTSAAPAADDSPTLTFEVATIKPAAPSPDGHTHIICPPGDRFSAQNITLLALMDWAWRLPATQILNGPAWLASARFDLQAKLNAEDAPLNASNDEDQARKRRMVASLLAERCNLKSHAETRVLPAYDLVLARGGSRLQPTTTTGRTINTYRNRLDLQGLPLAMIAEQLSYITGRIVVDKTNLTGRYDLKLLWTPDNTPVTDLDSPPTLFTAIQEQLGLKLEPAKEPIPVLVIDHIDPPSAN